MSLSRLALLTLAALSACGPEPGVDPAPDAWRGEDTGADTDAADVEPLSDLDVEVRLRGAGTETPYGDGSGEVELTARATGAVRYVFLRDGNAPIESASGEASLVFDGDGMVEHTIEVLAFAADGASARTSTAVRVFVGEASGPVLVWADEFDQDGAVDPDKWKPQTEPPLSGGWFNGELQHYTGRLDNAYVSDGTLKIVARKERWTVDGSARNYTSARLNSRFAFTYGRVEVRAKLPPEAGTWPAIWTLGANINELGNPFGDTYGDVGWPACGEIDILEQKGWDKQHTIAWFHWADTRTDAYANEGGEIRNPTATTAFHVYALDWDEERLEVFVDDALVWSMPNDEGRPYDNAHYLLLNIAMGGNLGGAVPADFDEAVMEIDYVRVFQ